MQARDIMTTKVRTISPDTRVVEIAKLMFENRISGLPVIDGEKLVGIIAHANLIQAIALAGEVLVESAGTDDASIRLSLLETLDQRPWWSSNTSNVLVSDGIVRFWGVEGARAKRDAARIVAENIAGVRGVEDHRSNMWMNFTD